MKRFSIVIVFAIVVLLVGSVVAQNIPLSKDTTDFVKNIAVKKGVSQNSIKNVEKVDFNKLPKEINIKNIDENNLAMYKVNVEDANSTNGTRPVYVITASETAFKKQIKNFANKMLLNFGMPGNIENSSFLLSGAGVQGSYEKGYVMVRSGSITGISTSLDVKNPSEKGIAEIILYKNGVAVGFRNTLETNSIGPKVDYDSVKENTINFEKGDVISAKVLLSNGTQVEDVNTLLEIAVEA